MRVSSRRKRARCVQLENCLSKRLACCFYKLPPTDCRHSIQNTTCCKRTCNPKQNFQLRAAHAPRQGKFYGKGRRHMQFSQYTNHKLFRIANFPCRERLPAVARGCKVAKLCRTHVRHTATYYQSPWGLLFCIVSIWLHGKCGACSFLFCPQGSLGHFHENCMTIIGQFKAQLIQQLHLVSSGGLGEKDDGY